LNMHHICWWCKDGRVTDTRNSHLKFRSCKHKYFYKIFLVK
jgi:hypothetical protein